MPQYYDSFLDFFRRNYSNKKDVLEKPLAVNFLRTHNFYTASFGNNIVL